MFHTGFQSSVQLMLITTVFLFSLNLECVCESVPSLSSTSFFALPLWFLPPACSPSSTSAVRHCVSSCYDYITLSVCCVHLDLKLITSDNLVVLFPKFKSFSGERVIERERAGGRDSARWSASSMLEVLTICRVQYINCLSVFDFRVV